MTILIAGGTGLIGRHLSRKLKTIGQEYKILSRQTVQNGITWKTLEKEGLPEKTSAIINLSGRNIGEMSPSVMTPQGYKEFLDDVRESRLKTTKLLSNLAAQCNTPPKYFINASAIGFYKPSKDKVYEESTNAEDSDFLTQLCADWEAAVKTNPTTRFFTLRFPPVLARDSAMLSQIYWPHKLGLGGKVGSGKQWFSWIHMDDVLQVLIYMLQGKYNEKVNPGHVTPVNMTAPEYISQLQFSKALSEAVNAPAKGLFPTPGFVFPLLMGKERAPLVLNGARIKPKFLLDSGYKFQHQDIKLALKDIYSSKN